MSLRIYLSLPLAAAFKGPRTDARDVTDKLDELVAKRPSGTPAPSRENIAERFRRLECCDLVVAPLLAPCFQVGVEIERAFACGIPIFFVAWGRPAYDDGTLPPFYAFPSYAKYAQDIEPLILGEEWRLEIERALEERLSDPVLLEIVQAAAKKRQRRRLSTSGFPEL